MSCCGNKRAALAPPLAPEASRRQSTKTVSPVVPPDRDQKMWADVHFEHQGAGTLTLTGSLTGRMYRWSGKGTVQAVDFRDAGGLMQDKLLRRVK
jgi:hypothetical protein